MGRPPSLRSHSFSAHLASRLLAVVGVASLAAAQASCSGGGALSTSTTTTTSGHGGAGTGGAPTTSGTAGSTGALSGFDAGIPESGLGPPPPGTECFDWPADAGDCPTDPTVVVFALDKNGCTDSGVGPTKEATTVVSGPATDTAGMCCYVVDYQWCVSGGRPYLVDDRSRVAPSRSGDLGWARGERPSLEGVDEADRAALAAAWTADALLEHASVASFSRFSLALLAAGAPADLVELAHRAALDEVRHAELCFALATAYAGKGVAPGPFPTGERIEVSAGLASLAASTVREGCVGETVASLVAAEQHARAGDPAVRAALAQIAADEARHAELAWRTVAWAIESGGSEVREAVAQAFALAETDLAHAPSPPLQPGDARTLEAHGRLDAATTATVVSSAMADVVGPAARALLRRRPSAPLESHAS